jgi:hypothetical protein
MEFGIIKSKIEKKLTESFLKNTFKKEMKTFKSLVLENSDVSKLFHIYNELNTQKGFEKEFADDFLTECIDLTNRISLSEKSISLLEKWVKGVKSDNNYKDIDNILFKNTLLIENIIESKKNIISKLTSKSNKTEHVNLSIEKVVEVANTTLKNYLESLNESDLEQVKKYLTLSKEEILSKYEILSELAIQKLETISSQSDVETKNKINETINKIKTGNVDSVSLLKLKNLTESL